MTAEGERVGVVIPTFKEEESIAALLQEIARTVPGVTIVVVDDSPDERTVAAAQGAGVARVSVVHRHGKGGRGSAVLEGLRALREAGCTRFIEMDADFSHPPGELPALLARARAGSIDLLIGSRYLPASRIVNWPLTRRWFSRSANLLARTLLRIPVRDYTNGYRVYSPRAAQVIGETCGKAGKGFIALSEILLHLHLRGLAIAEEPTVFTNRLRGESSVTFAEIRGALFGLFRILRIKREFKAQDG